jgi:hypothetical protein
MEEGDTESIRNRFEMFDKVVGERKRFNNFSKELREKEAEKLKEFLAKDKNISQE